MTNTPPRIDKYDTQKKRSLTKITHHLAKKYQKAVICQGLN